jgi:hypothetical protein
MAAVHSRIVYRLTVVTARLLEAVCEIVCFSDGAARQWVIVMGLRGKLVELTGSVANIKRLSTL